MESLSTPAPNWDRITALEANGRGQRTGRGAAVIPTTKGLLQVSVHSFGIRFRLGIGRTNEYGILLADPAEEEISFSGDDAETILEGAGLTLKIEHRPLAFTLYRRRDVVQRSPTDGHFARRFRLPPFARLREGWFVALELGPSEAVYGLGEKWGRLNKRGELVRSYNRDSHGVNAEASYKNTPYAWSPAGWAAFVNTPSPVTHGVGFAPWSHRAYGVLVEDQALDLFLLFGRDGPALLETYTEITGRASVPPLWSLGIILSKAYYKDAQELLETAREVRKRKLPCDVITLDGRAWLDTDTRFAFEWDAARYPDPAAVLKQLKEMSFKVCVWEYPLVSVKHPLFAEMAEKGWLLKDRRSGNAYRYQWPTGHYNEILTPLPESGVPDFTHPELYAFWRDSHKALFDAGVDMLKPDFGEQVEDNMLAANGESGHSLHNVYTLLYNRCVHEAAQRYGPSGPFLFTRSAWSGSQRYPSQWGGDPQADWGGLAGSLRGALSWGMSGGPYYATDIGGFYGDQRDSLLYARWAQAAVYAAHMRFHGVGPREPWSYDKAAADAAIAAARLRYRLIPYLHQAMGEAEANGMPVQRAMALAFPDEKPAWSFEEQFMFGSDMLVAPCLAPDGSVEVYLPQGAWRRFPDKESFEGSRTHRLTLGLDETAVFVREEAEIPIGPELEHTGQLNGEIKIEEKWRGR